MRKVSFLMAFLFCFCVLSNVKAGPVPLYESADEVELGDSGVSQTDKTTTFQPKDTKVIKAIEEETKATEDNNKKDAGKEKATKTSSKLSSGVLSGKAYVNSTGWLNLRAKPSKSSKRLAKLYYNDVVNIVGHQNGWYQIDSPKAGWVMAQFVSSTPNNNVNAEGSASISSGKGYVNCDGWLNLREKPTKKSAVLKKLYKNDEVNIIANNGTWYQIDSPQSGWVMAEFISASKTESSSSSSSESSSSSSESASEPPSEGTQVTGPITTEPMGGSESSLYNPGTKGNGTTTINTLGETWTVVKAPIGVVEYSKFLKSNKVCQNKDTTKYGSACLSFAYTHAWGLYCGNRGVSAEKRSGGGNFKTLIDDNKQYILNAVYLEIMAGRPCILHVNGNKQGTGRHFVTCIGFKSSVKSGETITEDDLLILDSWDAQIERMDQKNSRFMTTGKQCRKSYSGHRIQYMK